MYKVYILLLKNFSFYTGHTSDLKRRLGQHKNGEVVFTKNLRPVKLVYYEKFTSKQEAMARETQIKTWSKIKKINLIKYGHPNLKKIRKQIHN